MFGHKNAQRHAAFEFIGGNDLSGLKGWRSAPLLSIHSGGDF